MSKFDDPIEDLPARLRDSVKFPGRILYYWIAFLVILGAFLAFHLSHPG